MSSLIWFQPYSSVSQSYLVHWKWLCLASQRQIWHWSPSDSIVDTVHRSVEISTGITVLVPWTFTRFARVGTARERDKAAGREPDHAIHAQAFLLRHTQKARENHLLRGSTRDGHHAGASIVTHKWRSKLKKKTSKHTKAHKRVQYI